MAEEEKEETFPPLEKECPKCMSEGENIGGCYNRCWKCDGRGLVLTDFGEAVLELMERNFKRMLKDQIG